MNERSFDSMVKQLGAATNRRALIKGMLGLGSVALAGGAHRKETEAARRGYAGPPKLLGSGSSAGMICVDGCCVECYGRDPNSGLDNFQYCFANKPFCEGRYGEDCCDFCVTWASGPTALCHHRQ